MRHVRAPVEISALAVKALLLQGYSYASIDLVLLGTQRQAHT